MKTSTEVVTMVIVRNSVGLLTLLALLTWIQIAAPVEGYTLKEQEERIRRAERYSVYHNDTIFQGPRSAISPTRRWTSLTVPYIIDPSVATEGTNRINEAIQDYNTKTCIRWIPRTTETDYVKFSAAQPPTTTGTVCRSFIGRIGGEQEVTLTPRCTMFDASVTIHEMMHALGFFHEQSRPDRDNYVNILTGNIIAGFERNFDIETNSFTLDTPYDYTSIMHYQRNLFSTDPATLDTITTKTTQAINPANVLTDLDALDICLYYECTCPNQPLRSIVCQDNMMTISCPAGQVLSVVGAVFGRIEDTGSTCPSPNALLTNVKNCAQENTIDSVKASCDGASQCTLMATTAVFGDPCPTIYKYLSVVYRCNAANCTATACMNGGVAAAAPLCCTCPAGFTGTFCEIATAVNECATSNGGCAQVCTDTAASFTCSCNPGFMLAANAMDCTDIDECATNNGSCAQVCTNTAGSFTCSCNTGFTLAADMMACDDNNECAISNGGCAQVCTNTAGSFTCSCNTGFTLAADMLACDDIDECAISNGGCTQVCNNTAGSFMCSCNTGFRLAADMMGCNDIDECASSSGGCAQVCTNMAGSFSCSCNTGFTLAADMLACNDIDECATSSGGCAQVCTNTAGSFMCSCNVGFVLAADMMTCDVSAVNECATSNGGCAQVCTDTAASFTCSCNPGFMLAANAMDCNDKNECAISNGGCAQVCTNTPGSFTCSCNTGFTLAADMMGCNDNNECAISNGGCAQVCTNTTGSFTCSCNTGFKLAADMLACDDVNECDTANGGCDQICTNTVGTFVCSCNPGFALAADLRSCVDVTDVDECLNSNGGCEQLCTNTVGSFLCSCRSGFVLINRRACADINECSVNNGGCSQRCTNNPGSFSCSCDTGFSLDSNGRTCSATQPPNPCLTNNGGCQQICTNNGGSAQCSCNAGFTLDSNGMTCTVDQPPNPCLIGNGGCQQICMNNGGTALCSCNVGFTSNNNGVTCVANIPPTTAQPATTNLLPSSNLPPASNTPPGNNQAQNPCLINNGGCQQTCRNNGGIPRCTCLAGFSLNPDGRTCTAFIFINSSLADQNIFGGFPLNGVSFESCLIICLLTTSCGALSFDNQNACVLHPVNTACGQTFPQAGTTLYRLTTCPSADAAPLSNIGFFFQVIRALFGL